METKPHLNKKKTVGTIKNLKLKKYQCNCQRIWLLLSSSKNKNKNQIQCNSSAKETTVSEILDKTAGEVSVSKKIRKAHITRIPKIGCTIPYLITLFNNLSSSGIIPMDERQIMSAVNVTAKTKKDLDEGIKWKGNIQITDNLKLKLYKTGLILYHKK